jgi:hypothetical protein
VGAAGVTGRFISLLSAMTVPGMKQSLTRHGALQTRHKPTRRQRGPEFSRHAAAFCREMDKAQKPCSALEKQLFSLEKG